MINKRADALENKAFLNDCNGLSATKLEELYFAERDKTLVSLMTLALNQTISSKTKKRKVETAANQLMELGEYLDHHRTWVFESRVDFGEGNSKVDFIQDEIRMLNEKLRCWERHIGTYKDWYHFYHIALFIKQAGIDIDEGNELHLRRILKQGIPAMVICNY